MVPVRALGAYLPSLIPQNGEKGAVVKCYTANCRLYGSEVGASPSSHADEPLSTKVSPPGFQMATYFSVTIWDLHVLPGGDHVGNHLGPTYSRAKVG